MIFFDNIQFNIPQYDFQKTQLQQHSQFAISLPQQFHHSAVQYRAFTILIKQQYQHRMKSAEIGIEQASKMFIKFFDFNYDIPRLASNMKRTIKQVQTKLKQQIKSLLIDLQGDLLRSKRITNIVFLNLINPQIQKKLIHIDKILDKKSAEHFLNYYRSRLIQFNINMPHHLETVYPISVDSRISIYMQFVQYARSQHLVSQYQKQNPQTAIDIIKKGFMEDRHEVYQQKQMDFLFVVYEKNKGNVDAIFEQLQNRGLKDKKYERPILQFKLANLKLIGLHKVYTATSNWMDDNLLRWNKFIKCYGNSFVNWSEDDQKKLLKIAINDQPTIQEIKHITFKMGCSSVELQKYQIQQKSMLSSSGQSFQFREEPRRTFREPVVYINPRAYSSQSYQELSPENYYEPVRRYHQQEPEQEEEQQQDQQGFSDEFSEQFYREEQQDDESPEPAHRQRQRQRQRQQSRQRQLQRQRYQEPRLFTSYLKQSIKKKIATSINNTK